MNALRGSNRAVLLATAAAWLLGGGGQGTAQEPAPAGRDLQKEWQIQYTVLKRDLSSRRHFARVRPETFREEALILPEDRDPADVVVRRTAALLADLQRRAARPDFATLAQELGVVAAAAKAVAVEEAEARCALFETAFYGVQ